MIDINLIPAALRKDGQGKANALEINIPKEILVGTAIGVVLFLIVVHLLIGAIWLLSMGRLAATNQEWQKVAADKAQLDAISGESTNLKKKIKLISDMTTKKIVLWAPKFNAISDDISRGLWIRRMTLDKTGLTIEGSVVSKTRNEINNVGKFISSLKLNDDFMKDFSTLEVNSIERGDNDAVEVTDFTVIAKQK